MLRTLPVLVESARSAATRPLHMERFPDGSGFVFNLERPAGIKYLLKPTFDRLQELVRENANPPILPSLDNPVDVALAAHNLIATNSVAQQPVIHPTPSTLTVWFHISNACNLSCSYCYIPHLAKAADSAAIAANLMSWDRAAQAIQGIFDLCQREGFRRLKLKFAGGEPTLNVEVIAKSCELAEELSAITGIEVTFRMLTNGVFDTARVIPILVRHRIGVSISVDGEPEVHDQTRFTISRAPSGGGPLPLHPSSRITRSGTWRTITRTVEELGRHGIKPYLLCTVTERNYLRLEGMVQFALSRKIGFRLSPVRDGRTHARPGLQNRLLDTFASLYEWIGVTYPASMPIERFARFGEWDLAKPKRLVCGTCRSTMAIDQSGAVSSCQMRMDAPAGNLTIEPVHTAFDRIRADEENRYLVTPELKTGECVSCQWRYTCAGGCPEHTRTAKATTNASSPWCGLYMGLLPHYLRAAATQIKRGVDTRLHSAVVVAAQEPSRIASRS